MAKAYIRIIFQNKVTYNVIGRQKITSLENEITSRSARSNFCESEVKFNDKAVNNVIFICTYFYVLPIIMELNRNCHLSHQDDDTHKSIYRKAK